MENAPKKFFRLTVGGEVRLRYAYIIRCDQVLKDEHGEVVELHCTYDPDTRSGGPNESSRKVKGTIHWVSCQHSMPAEVRLVDRLFLSESPDDAPEGKTFLDNLNPDSMKMITAQVEPSLSSAKVYDRFQFERLGYFCVDTDSRPGTPIFNRIVGLRDSWAKEVKKQA